MAAEKPAHSAYTLGLDLGSNSIGWALVDNERIVNLGVRIFPEGVDRDTKGTELSKNAGRRIARGMRRQIARRARRKRRIREALVIAGFFATIPDTQATAEATNPYELRRRGLDERLTLPELGRILMHLSQRRGFLSNKKADKGKKSEASETLEAINQLEQEIAAAGHRTLGEHLAALYAANPLERLRGKHTRRNMYEQEFHAIWEKQREFYSDILTDQLKFGRRGPQSYPRKPEQIGKDITQALQEVGLFGLIFFQRPMYWPKWVVGQCELNPKQKRAPRAERCSQLYRIYSELNNLRIFRTDGEIVELSTTQREKLLKLLMENAEVKFEVVRKKLGLLEQDGFNLETGNRTKLKGMETDALLKKAYGKDWFALPEERKNEIVRSLIHQDENVFLERATSEWGLDRETADRLLAVNLPDGYASYSRETIEKLLPFIQQGIPLTARAPQPCAVRLAGFLPPWDRPVKGGKILPPPPDITNPIVRQGLCEVRKLINAVIREYGIPRAIHIELAREVKGNAEQRNEQTWKMREREKIRDGIAKVLQDEYGEKPTRAKIERYILWEEQGKVCIYSGREISVRQLLGGEVDVDHILPYSRSLDDSLMNKVVCFVKENRDKGQQTVYEWVGHTNPEKYEQIMQRAAKFPLEIRNRKRVKFSQKTCQLEDFIARQLNDTAYITSAVVEYVKCLGTDVLGSKGQLTAELRHEWGLNDVLRDDGLNLKNRDDHRHHAVDAVVIALTDRSRLHELAHHRGNTPLAEPWPHFRKAVVEGVNSINVSFRVRRKVAGALHKEKPCGETPVTHEYVRRESLHALSPAMIPDIRDTTIRNIIIARLKTFGIEIGRGKSKDIPPAVWAEPLRMKSGVVIQKVRVIKKGANYRNITNKKFVELGSNHHIAIFDVLDKDGHDIKEKDGRTKRIGVVVSTLESAQQITKGRQTFERQKRQILKLHGDSLDRRDRIRELLSSVSKQYPVLNRNNDVNHRFVMTLSINESFLLQMPNKSLVLHRIQKMSEGSLILRPHTYAGKVSDSDKPPLIQRKTPNTLIGHKVTVDLLGRIRWAND